MDDRLGREEVDAAEFAVGERAAFARGLALLVGIVGEIRFEDAHHEPVEGVAMRFAEQIAGLGLAPAARPLRRKPRRMNEAGAKKHGDYGNCEVTRQRNSNTCCG